MFRVDGFEGQHQNQNRVDESLLVGEHGSASESSEYI